MMDVSIVDSMSLQGDMITLNVHTRCEGQHAVTMNAKTVTDTLTPNLCPRIEDFVRREGRLGTYYTPEYRFYSLFALCHTEDCMCP